MFQQENTEFRVCAETCMLQPCLKFHVFSHTNISALSVLTLADPPVCYSHVLGLQGPQCLDWLCWLLMSSKYSTGEVQPLLPIRTAVWSRKISMESVRFKKCPVSERARNSSREMRDITGTTVLRCRAARHTHQIDTDLNYFQIHFQTQVTQIVVKISTV